MPIDPARFGLALDLLKPEDGFEFERFANEFLASEIPGLRPVGGIHDGGRDAFISQVEGLPRVFCQHSVTKDWRDKVRSTVLTLRKNGYDPSTIIYCSNLVIQAEADNLRKELYSERITLDIRDRTWFLAVVNANAQRVTAAERLSRQFVDQLLRSKSVIASISPSLTLEEERIATTYLQLELSKKDPSKGVVKACIEGLVSYFPNM